MYRQTEAIPGAMQFVQSFALAGDDAVEFFMSDDRFWSARVDTESKRTCSLRPSSESGDVDLRGVDIIPSPFVPRISGAVSRDPP